MLKRSPYNQPVQPARKPEYFTFQEKFQLEPQNDSADDHASFVDQMKRKGQHLYQLYDSDLKSTMSKLRVMEYLENSSSGNNIFKVLKHARSQGGLVLGTSISRLISVNNNSQYQKLLRIQNLESQLERKRHLEKLIVPPLSFTHQFPSRNVSQNFDNSETQIAQQHNETQKLQSINPPNKDSRTVRRKESMQVAKKENQGVQGSNDPQPNKYDQIPPNFIVVKRKTKPFRPFDITSKQSTDRQFQSEPSESFDDTITSNENTDQPPAFVEGSGDYDPFLVPQFQPSRTFVSQGARSMPLDATPEQDSLEEADQECKSSIVTEVVSIQEEQKTALRIESPLEIKNAEFDNLNVQNLRQAAISMANIPQDLKEYLEEENKNTEVQQFNELTVENFDISKGEERQDTPEIQPPQTLKNLDFKGLPDFEESSESSQSFKQEQKSSIQIEIKDLKSIRFDLPDSFDPLPLTPIQLQTDSSMKIESAFSLQKLYSQIQPKSQPRLLDPSPKAKNSLARRQTVKFPTILSSKKMNTDIDELAFDFDLSDDFEILQQDKPTQFKKLVANFTLTVSEEEEMKFGKLNIQKHLMKRDPLQHLKDVENYRKNDQNEGSNENTVSIYNHNELLLQTVDPDLSDIEDVVELTVYDGHPQTSFTGIGQLILNNVFAMAVLQRISFRINSAGKLKVSEWNSSFKRDTFIGNESSPITSQNKSDVKRNRYTFTEKKEKSEAHLDNVINALIQAEQPIIGSTESANIPPSETSDDSDLETKEGKILTEFITKVITVKRLLEIDDFLTSNTYMRAKKKNDKPKQQQFLEQSQLARNIGANLRQTYEQTWKLLKTYIDQEESKIKGEDFKKEQQRLLDLLTQSEFSKYLDDRFPLTQSYQLELKNINTVSRMQLAFINVTNDIVEQMEKIKQNATLIKRQVFQNRTSSNTFSQTSQMSITSKFQRPKTKVLYKMNLQGIPEDESLITEQEEYNVSPITTLDWNEKLKQLESWGEKNLLFQFYLKPFSCDLFLKSQHFTVEATFTNYVERHSRFHFSTSYSQYIKKTIQDKVFEKNYKNVLKLAIAKRNKYLEIFGQTRAYFELNMNKQLLQMNFKMTKQGNVIFNRYGIVKFLSSAFASDETLIMNCLHNANDYPKQMINQLRNIYKKTTNDGYNQLQNSYNIKKNLDSLRLEMFRCRSNEFSFNKYIVINNDLVFLDIKNTRDQSLPVLEGKLQFAQEIRNPKLIRSVTEKIERKKTLMLKKDPVEETFSTVSSNLERLVSFGNLDQKVAQGKFMSPPKKSTQNLGRRSTIQVLNSIPRWVRYQQLSTFMLSEDFGYITQIQSAGNYMVFTPILAKTLFGQGQSYTPVNKIGDYKSQLHNSHSFGRVNMGVHESDLNLQGYDPSPIKEMLCEDDDFDSDSSFGKASELIASMEMLENKFEESKSNLDPLQKVQTIKMSDKNRLKELKQRPNRASTEVTDDSSVPGMTRSVRKMLDYEAISEKTGESDFGIRDSPEHQFIGSGVHSGKNENRFSVAQDERSSKKSIEVAPGIKIPIIKDHGTDEEEGEEFVCEEIQQTSSNSKDTSSSLEQDLHDELGDQTPQLNGNNSKKSSKFDLMNVNAIRQFLARTQFQRTNQAKFSQDIVEEPVALNQVHKAEYRDLQSYYLVQELTEKNKVVQKNVITIVRPKSYTRKLKQPDYYTQGLMNRPINNFFKSKPIVPQYLSQQNVKSFEDAKPEDKKKVVQYLIQKNRSSSQAKEKGESALIVSLAQVMRDKDRRNHLKVLKAIEQNNLKQVQHFNRSNHQGVDITDKFGNTLLNFAAQYGCLEICELLINSGFKLNTRNNYGNTPLHYAIAFNHQQLADVLIQNGADEDIKNNKKLTPWQGI